MKRIDLNRVLTFQLCIMLSLTCVSCNARTPKKQALIMKELISPVLKDSLSDSICNILLSSEKVKVERLIANPSQSKKMPTKWLSKKETGMATFLLIASDSITHPSQVFGRYSPNVRFTFYYKKSSVVAEIDFGLQQVCFIGKDETKFDVKENYLLKLCNMLFPNDEYLSFLLKERTK